MKTPAATEVTTSAQNSADSTELTLVPTKTEPRVDSRLLPKQSVLAAAAVRKATDRHQIQGLVKKALVPLAELSGASLALEVAR